MKQWVFRPALHDDRPVAVWVAIPVKFRCDKKGEPRFVPPLAVDLCRAFVQEIAALQAKGARVPSGSDTTLRRWIIQDALALDPRPLVPPEARAHFARGCRKRVAPHGPLTGT